MHAKEAFRNSYEFSQMVLTSYVSDLTDAELLTRPAEGCNHVAWQLGHLISSECNLVQSIIPDYKVELPDGFVEKHSKDNSASNDPADFLGTEEYLALFDRVKEATFKALDAQSDEDLSQPAPENLRQLCSNVGGVWGLIASHAMMHVGQFVPVRRKLGKPIVI